MASPRFTIQPTSLPRSGNNRIDGLLLEGYTVGDDLPQIHECLVSRFA